MSIFRALYTAGLNFRVSCVEGRFKVAVGSERHGWLAPSEASSLQAGERELDRLARECFPRHRYATQPAASEPPLPAFQVLCDRGHDFEFATLWDGSNTVRIDGKEVFKQEVPDFDALEGALSRFLEAA